MLQKQAKNTNTPAPRAAQTASPFPQMEEEVLSFWEQNTIFEKSVEREALQGDSYKCGIN